ncbi:serine proteinase inhibitor, putative [Ixodes scapularis]|uniref:Serine proteinase inhibitor, putative n=1 Tax=Ixodes scapularis TaxID=6945 RepID=B7PNJ5_IXOSC|nr:serine proteinase inhibitor, putative [Ixodes scapularis]|eukprot:XP_002435343.1 serine proteinase inhibitor, putative [Ixodes scapularis]
MPMYGFNAASQKCEEFEYKGCGGNGNNFLEKHECWSTCASKPLLIGTKLMRIYLSSGLDSLENPTRKCLRPAVKQTKGTHVRYFYNMTSNTCERSRYWLKDDSKNRFVTLEECESTCKRKYDS